MVTTAVVYSTSTEQARIEQRRRESTAAAVRAMLSAPVTHSVIGVGMCLACGAVEVRLDKVTGYRDGCPDCPPSTYPVGYGCEVCS